MKKSFALVCMLLVCLFSCKKKQADVLARIKKDCAKTNQSLKDMTKKQVDDIISSSGGTITGYYADDQIKKIYTEHYTDTCRTFSSYYFNEGLLIFAEEQNFIYNRPMRYTEEVAKANNDSVWYDDKKTRLVINHYYFYKEKLIKWMADDIDVPVNTQAFTDRQSEVWAQSALLIKELKEE